VLAAKGPPDHAVDAEILFVKLPLLEKLGYHRSLLVPATKLWHIPGIRNHGEEVKVGC
jgi:hypothetical protein